MKLFKVVAATKAENGNTDMVNLTDEETTQRIAANLEIDNG